MVGYVIWVERLKTHMEKDDELYATKHMAIQKFYSKFYS